MLGRLAGFAARWTPVGRTRTALATRYLHGSGIEIGALHNPLRVGRRAHVRYVDRMALEELRRHYPELNSRRLVEPDVVDDGERLERFEDGSVDFVIANHFLEHCEDPVRALENMVRVLRPGGVLYLAVPDKRHTFDAGRPVTPVGHVLADYREGPDGSRRAHFEEWARLVDRVPESEIGQTAAKLMERGYSIHYHVWTYEDLLEFVDAARGEFGLDVKVEEAVRNGHENVLVLRRGGRGPA